MKGGGCLQIKWSEKSTFKQESNKEESTIHKGGKLECFWKGDSICKGPVVAIFAFCMIKKKRVMCSQNELRKRETGVGIGCYFKERGQAAPFSDNQEFDFFFLITKDCR